MNRRRKTDRHLPACMYQKHGAYWLVRENRWHRLGTDLQSALVEYARMRERPKGGMVRLIDDALAQMRPKLAPSTAAQYEVAAKKLREILAEFEPSQVRPKHVAAIKVSMRDHPNMANRCLSVLRSVFALALEWQLVESNPVTGIRRHAEAKRDRYLTDNELAAIRAAAAPRLQCIIDLLYLTGQRVSDVLKIRLSDLASEGIQFQQGKTGAKLLVAWTPELRTAVERSKALQGNIRALTLFCNRLGKTPDYDTTRQQWEEACAAAKIRDAHIHDIRAKALTDAKRQGLNPTALAGHASAAMTERYIRAREVPVVQGPGFGKKNGFN